MDADPKLERLARTYAFMATLANAAGRDQSVHDYIDRMMRAWALLGPRDGDAALSDADRLHGASGSW